MTLDFTISAGFSDAERETVAALYWEAFATKLHYVLGPPEKAMQFITAQLNPTYALVARGPEGQVLGVAGFKTSQGALIGGEMNDITAVYGWLASLWRVPLLALVERDLADDILLMDGICVTAAARGMGLGSALLQAIKDEASNRRLSSIRLDVIDSNPRARALYERQGFEPMGTEQLGPLRWVFGFKSSTKMLCRVG